MRSELRSARPSRRIPAVVAVLVLAAAVCTLGGAALAAERVELRDGRTLEGEISRMRDGSVAVHTADGTEIVRRDQIARIVPLEGEEAGAARKRGPTLAEVIRATATTTDADGQQVPRRYRTEEIRHLREQLAEFAAEDPVAREIQRSLRDFESSAPDDRVAAMQRIREGWPQTLPAVRVVLVLGSEQARLDATRLLRDPTLGDTTTLCKRAVRDDSLVVRMHALRAIREKQLRSFAPVALDILTGSAPWTLRQEAARALERIGDRTMLLSVVQLWESESDAGRKGRLRRLMRSLHGADLGDDPQPWLDAARRGEIEEPSDQPGTDAAHEPGVGDE